MEYAILIYSEPSTEPETWNDDERAQRFFGAMNAFADELRKNGELVTARRLQSTEVATTVRRDGDQVLVTDGPFADTKESLGGFFLVDCEDLDRALEVARTIPVLELGSIEVRPIRGRSDP